MKLLIMQFSPTSCHSIPLRSNYTPQRPVTINTYELKKLLVAEATITDV
jgi:hypothetical protein